MTWQGLYYHGQHHQTERVLPSHRTEMTTECTQCDAWCFEEYPCRCCLGEAVRQVLELCRQALLDDQIMGLESTYATVPARQVWTILGGRP